MFKRKKIKKRDEMCQCGKKFYGYTDGVHEIDLCFACGKFSGDANGDSEFTYMVLNNPEVILGMIKEKFLIPRN